MSLPEFKVFDKIPRLNREVIVTEKIDGTNAQITVIEDPGNTIDPYGVAPVEWAQMLERPEIILVKTDKFHRALLAGSRNRYLSAKQDNYQFWAWVYEHREHLAWLGRGTHYGEWWGQGIQRGYGLKEKKFSLFNTHRWLGKQPPCCDVVPVVTTGTDVTKTVSEALTILRERGSVAAPGFMDPEGIIVFHTAANSLFKVTLEGDEEPKSKVRIA